MTTIATTARRLLRGHEPLRADDGIAMVMALMLILVIGTLTIGIAGVTLAEMKPTELLQKNVQTVHGAEAGVDAGLGRVRAAVINNVGVRSLLPCNTATSATGQPVALTGDGSEGAGGAAYAVTIRYYMSDPSDQDTAWRSANALACVGTSGPASVPLYALIESTGSISTGRTASSGNRTLESTYAFSRKLNNVAGGMIRVYNSTGYCLVAGSMTAGSQISLQLCANPALDKNLTQWTYLGTAPPTTNSTAAYPLGIALVSTLNATTPLCITAPNGSSGALVSLQACSTDASPSNKTTGKLAQQWSFNDNGQFAGANTNGTPNNYCLASAVTPVPGATLTTASCSSATPWQPDPTVGAGQAGSTTGLPDVANGQLVNFKEFGRCFDITGANINTTYIIDYPCKQAPDASNVKWNQRESWDYDATTGLGSKTIRPTGSGAPSNYCLSVSSTGPSSTEKYAVFSPCTGSASQQWMFTGVVTGDYAGSYLVKNVGAGSCLGLGAANASLTAWSTITVEKCDGSDTGQKWNAPANLLSAGRNNTRENTGLGSS